MSRSFIDGGMFSILLNQDESKLYRSYIHERVEYLVWFIALGTCYYYWFIGNEEIAVDFTAVNRGVFFAACFAFLFLQSKVNEQCKTDAVVATALAIGLNGMFLLLAHFFCYYMFGLAFLCLISINFRLFNRYLVWGFSLAAPFLSGWYDVHFKELPFYLDTKSLFAALNLLMLTICEKTLSERKIHEQANRLIKVLKATRFMMEHSAKRNERLRISRDLHDSAGHYLTSMNMQLELAMLAQGEAKQESIKTAKEVGRLLYQEIRGSVKELRAFDEQELRVAIQELAENMPDLAVDTHFEIKEGTLPRSHAEIVFRCVQESLTNTIRHSNATHAKIIVSTVNGTKLQYQDNDSVGSPLVLGNGLTGLKERVEESGGTFSVRASSSGIDMSVIIEKEMDDRK